VTRIVAVGDNDIDCYLSNGMMYPGGNCLNVSVFARRCGAKTAYVGAVGNDTAGQLIRRALEAEGVETSRLRVVEGDTAHCVIGHRGNDRYFVSYDLGVSRFDPDAGDLDFIAGFDAVHVYQHSGLDAFLGEFAARAKLSYDFSTRRDAAHRALVAPHCWLASLSSAELSVPDTIALTHETHVAGARWVLATRGSEGALLSNGAAISQVSSTPVEVMDTLGAGDAFIARTMVGLLRNEAADMLLKAAADAAAATCGYLGAIGYGERSTVALPA
jgi:fructoselysine 6-kinase